MRTMTDSQMAWSMKRGFAWFGRNSDGTIADDWRQPIWTKAGGWLWNPDTQRYELTDGVNG